MNPLPVYLLNEGPEKVSFGRLLYSSSGDPYTLSEVKPLTPLGLPPPEILYHRDDALSTKPVMHYQGTAYLCY